MTLTCAQFEAEWNRVLDGEEPAISAAGTLHAADCDHCRFLNESAALLGPLPCPQAPAFGFADRVVNANRSATALRRRTRLAGGCALAASLALALYVSGAFAPKGKTPEQARIVSNDELKQAFAKMNVVGREFASASRKAAETPLDLPAQFLKLPGVQPFESVGATLQSVGEGAKQSLEPLVKTAGETWRQLLAGRL